MTTMDYVEQKCAVCEKTSEQLQVFSSNNFGYNDLDSRPSEMYRSTIHTWVLECPHCGYAARDIGENPGINTDLLKTEKYKTCDSIEFRSELSKIFYRAYLIEMEKPELSNAFYTILQCVWTCDDNKDIENSKTTRRFAIRLADELIKSDKEDNDNLLLIKSDLLRRIGEFDLLIEEYENFIRDDELVNKIIRFQVKKARQKDDKCYTLKEVLEDE